MRRVHAGVCPCRQWRFAFGALNSLRPRQNLLRRGGFWNIPAKVQVADSTGIWTEARIQKYLRCYREAISFAIAPPRIRAASASVKPSRRDNIAMLSE